MAVRLGLQICFVAVLLTAQARSAPVPPPSSPITDLFNTGVNSAGNSILGAGVADPHYSLIVSPTSSTAVTVDDTNYPFPPWLANTGTSRWIGPSFDALGTGGSSFIYRTTFTVPANALLSSVSVAGKWAIDDNGTDILINGISTGQTYGTWTALGPFSVTSGFVHGANTLDFVVANIGFAPFTNATGLRVADLSGSYQVPEAGSASLAAIGLLLSAASARCLRYSNRREAAMS